MLLSHQNEGQNNWNKQTFKFQRPVTIQGFVAKSYISTRYSAINFSSNTEVAYTLTIDVDGQRKIPGKQGVLSPNIKSIERFEPVEGKEFLFSFAFSVTFNYCSVSCSGSLAEFDVCLFDTLFYPTLTTRLFNNQKYSDFTFCFTDDKTIYANKIILSTWSPVLSKLFYETSTPTNTLACDNLYKEMYNLVYFCYTGELHESVADITVCMATYELARQYEIQRLVENLTEKLLLLLDMNNVCNLLIFADTKKDIYLENGCMYFISQNKHKVVGDVLLPLMVNPSLLMKVTLQISNPCQPFKFVQNLINEKRVALWSKLNDY